MYLQATCKLLNIVTDIMFENYDNNTPLKNAISTYNSKKIEFKWGEIKLTAMILFFRKYQVGYLATRSQNKNKEKRDFFPTLWSKMITMKPRFIYTKQKNDSRFYS